MGQVFSHPTIDLTSGLDLGVLMATSGLLYGLVSGIVWINLGVRAGWVQQQEPLQMSASQSGAHRDQGIPIGYAKVSGETIDPLLLQVIWLTLAFGMGLALQLAVTEGVGFVEGWVDNASEPGTTRQQLSERLTLHSVVGSFPLFIYTLFGGLVVRRTLRAVGYEHAIDRDTINRLSSTAMDILVVSAIATLNVTAVATLIVPFTILLACGAIWTGVCLLVISPWLLPGKHWFELGLINYGMSTGTTATGFVLLRLVDPELESGAAEDYAMAAPLSAPFVGGGMITVGLPLLVLERFHLATIAIALSAIVIAMIVVGRRWNATSTSVG